jgi:(R,R)-butanediol dehydrogenase/meso-butanediol dehydrogenase/diacetyl reductase
LKAAAESNLKMSNQMIAAVYHAAGDVRLEKLAIPTPTKGEVLLKVLRSGMCGTDASEFKSGPKIFPTQTRHAASGHQGPMVLGHEFIGEIQGEVDPALGFNPGDIVASGAGISCGACKRCKEGRTNLCDTYVTLGLNRHGGMAEYVAVPASTLVKVPQNMNLDAAGIAQPLAVGLHAARRSGVSNGDRVLLIGSGAIGTFVLAALKFLYQAEVTVLDFGGSRLERASRLGADHVVEVGPEAAKNILDSFQGNPIDVVIEASGAPGQLKFAIDMVRRGGSILQVGLPTGPQVIDIHKIVMSEIDIHTTLAHVCGQDLAVALEILSTTRLAAELIEGVYPLSEVSNQLELLSTGKIQGKVLFNPEL